MCPASFSFDDVNEWIHGVDGPDYECLGWSLLSMATNREKLIDLIQRLLDTWENKDKKPGWVKRFCAVKDEARALLADPHRNKTDVEPS